jgi:hypothetical protein
LVALLAAGLLIAIGPRACSNEPGTEARIDTAPPGAAPLPGPAAVARAGGAGRDRPGERRRRTKRASPIARDGAGESKRRGRRRTRDPGRIAHAPTAPPRAHIPEAPAIQTPPPAAPGTASPGAGGGGSSGADEFF